MKTETKPSVRVNLAAKEKLEKIQLQTSRSQTALLDRAIDLLERETMTQQIAADFAELAENPELLARYKEISAAFENAASDGLRNE
jgi:predicted transcriptional regulator